MSSENKKSHSATKSKPTTTVSKSVGNYERHPFFVKKAAGVKALLLEVGLPKQLTSKVRR
jgi:hypothetical protein